MTKATKVESAIADLHARIEQLETQLSRACEHRFGPCTVCEQRRLRAELNERAEESKLRRAAQLAARREREAAEAKAIEKALSDPAVANAIKSGRLRIEHPRRGKPF